MMYSAEFTRQNVGTICDDVANACASRGGPLEFTDPVDHTVICVDVLPEYRPDPESCEVLPRRLRVGVLAMSEIGVETELFFVDDHSTGPQAWVGQNSNYYPEPDDAGSIVDFLSRRTSANSILNRRKAASVFAAMVSYINACEEPAHVSTPAR